MHTLFGATIFVGIGNGLTMPSSNAGVLATVRPQLAGTAAGLAGALTIAGAALLAGITGVFLNEQTGAYLLLGMMLLCVMMGLGAALYTRMWLASQQAVCEH